MPQRDVRAARRRLRDLIDDSNPAAAPIAYYALFHPVERSALFLSRDEQAFVGRFQTGMDLFRPLVTVQAPSPEVASELFAEALTVGRPYIFFSSLNQLSVVGGSLTIQNERILRIFAADPSQFRAEGINVMVKQKRSHDGTPRFEIGEGNAVAGLNWQSPAFAEIYVHTDSAARQRGWGKSVVAALTAHLLKNGTRPIYLVENSNEASLSLAQSLGFTDTGSRQIYADVVYSGNP